MGKQTCRQVAVKIAKEAKLDCAYHISIDKKARANIANLLGAIAEFSSMKFVTRMDDETSVMTVFRVK